jgi:EmrB/QacA subfamily drug resistance transporter
MDQLVRDENRRSAEIGVLPSADEPREPLTESELRAIMVSLMLSMFLAALDQTIVATALPTIGHQFLDVSNLSWVITAYLVSSTAMSPVFGTLSDIYGRRVMIALALSLFIAGSVLCALAPNLIVLILARALQGFGGGGILPVAQTIIADVITPRERGQYQAYFSAVWASAGIGGPILGGVMTEYLDWSVIFWINVPLGLAAMAVLLPKMSRIPVHHRRRQLDWIGGLLLMAAAVVVLLVLTWGGTRFAWRSPEIVAMIAAALALTGIFIWHARRTAEPFLPLPLMGGTVVPFAMVTGGFSIGAMIGLTVYLPMYYEVVYGLPASQAGLALIPLVAISVAGSSAAGRVMGHMKRYKWAAISGTAIAAVLFAAMAVATPMPLWLFLLLLSLGSLGLGTAFPTSTVSIQNAVARHQVGTATGAANFFRSLLSSFTVAAFTAILLAALGAHVAMSGRGLDITHDLSAVDTVAAFRAIFAAAAALMAIECLAVTLMEERPLAGPPDVGPVVTE